MANNDMLNCKTSYHCLHSLNLGNELDLPAIEDRVSDVQGKRNFCARSGVESNLGKSVIVPIVSQKFIAPVARCNIWKKVFRVCKMCFGALEE